MDTPLLYRLETDLGVFSIDRKHRRFNFSTGDEQGYWTLDDVSDIKFESGASYAFLLELFYGLDVTDLFKPYRDTIEHFVVYVQTRDGRRMPVFSVRQYKPRDFLMGWYIAMEEIVLGNLRLFVNARDYSRLAYRKVWQAFADSGISPHAS